MFPLLEQVAKGLNVVDVEIHHGSEVYPIGRCVFKGHTERLGFVLQEMNREANTIASKANDADIAKLAVGLKEEIERLREQVENVE